MQIIKRLLKMLLTTLLLLILSILLYLLTAYLFSLFPKKESSHKNKNSTVYLLYNEMHTDIVFNVEDINLTQLPEFKSVKKGYLAFGWGDKETYLNTPTWNELKLSTSFKALFLNTPSLMHVSYYNSLKVYSDVKEIKMTKEAQKYLKERIFESFNENRTIYHGYGRDDLFYSAKGKYNILCTCNTWTGDQLRDANVSMSYWTPLSQNVTASFP